MKNPVTYFFSEYNFPGQTKLFRQLLYIFLLIKVCYWLYYYDLYFGQNAIAFTRPYSLGTIKNLAFILYNGSEPGLGYFFIIGSLIFILLSCFLARIPFIFEFILWLLIVNIHNKIYPTLTGGDFLLNQFLFFNCFFSKNHIANNSWQSSLSRCLHNFAVLAVIIQIQLVYFIAGAAKLNSSDWFTGSAINNLSHIQHFNLFSGPLIKSAVINCFFNYAVLFYQILFPALIWIKKIKKPMIILGVIMHLYIAFIIGLPGFAFMMMIGYVFFWPFKKQLV